VSAATLLALVLAPVAVAQHAGEQAGAHSEVHAEAHTDSSNLAAMAASVHGGDAYDPASRVDPFDTLSQEVSRWLNPRLVSIQRKDDGWRSAFCGCIENGLITSWYQYASALYIVDTCQEDKGLILRTGHMQDRHEHPLQAAMACDMLKLISYCFSHECGEPCLDKWNNMCEAAHYTVVGCDVDCSAATMGVGQPAAAFFRAALVGAVAMVFALS